MMYEKFSYQKAVLAGFIFCCLTVPFLSLGTGCGSGGGGVTGAVTTDNTTANNTATNGNNTGNNTGGRTPSSGEKAGYLGRLIDNATGLGISGAVFVINGQRAVSNSQGYFNLELPNGSAEVEASLEVARYQSYIKNVNIRSLDNSGKSLAGCTNTKRFFVPSVAKGLVWDMGNFTLYPDSADSLPAGPCGL
jgi:hypothetical protein